MTNNYQRIINSIKASGIITLMLLFFPLLKSPAQKYIKDSVLINFKTGSEVFLLNYSCDTTIDNRNISPHIIGVTEKNKYLLVPVDFYYCLNEPLNK